jgi:hypothetical protein
MAKQLSTQAQAAKQIRAILKEQFPTVTFKVTSDSFSGGDAVRIEWTDGPTTKQVDALVDKYQYGHFDGMIDLYEYSNRRTDIPQSKYVHTQRDISVPARVAMIELLNRTYAGYALRYEIKTSPATKRYPAHTWVAIDPASDQHTGHGWQSHEVNRQLHSMSLLCWSCDAHTLPGDKFCPTCGKNLSVHVVEAA